MRTNNIILAGVPRSGTTLACHLLNKLPDIVALHEPMSPPEYLGLTSEEIIQRVKGFFLDQRESLLRDGSAKSKSVGGLVPDNTISGHDERTGKRKNILNSRVLRVDKPLNIDFKLAIKQPNFFTAKLEDLLKHFECFAIIRNPLSALLSWNSVDMPVSNGYAPGAEAFDKALSHKLRNEDDRLARQLILIAWYFETYARLLPSSRIVRYEDIVESGGKALAKISASASQLQVPLRSQNNSSLYDPAKKRIIAEKLLDSDGCYWAFYRKDEITRLIKA